MKLLLFIFYLAMCLSIGFILQVAAQKCKNPSSKVQEGRKCRRSCKTNADCKGDKKTCNCDSYCGLTCFNLEAECSIPAIEHGTVKYDSRIYNQEVEYSCDDGYVLKGESKRVCQSDREWSGVQPECVEKGCDYPPRISTAYANVGISTFEIGVVVTYVCRFGYIRSGNPNITCQSDRTWSERNIKCSRISCGDPGNPINGHIEAKDFLFGTWITYKCDEGYEMSDSRRNRRYCSTTGAWSGTAITCNIKTCPAPDEPINGRAEVMASFEYQSIVKYYCNQGYMLEGDNEGVCNDKGTWGSVPTCKVDVNCDFDSAARPTCGYANRGTVDWKRVFVREDTRTGIAGYVMTYEPAIPAGGSAIFHSPSIPTSVQQCLQFYFRIENLSGSNEDIVVKLNGRRHSILARNGIRFPLNRWFGYQTTLHSTEKQMLFEIVAEGDKKVSLDDLKLVKSECKHECTLNPCMNGGDCVDTIDSYFCSCPTSHIGKRCQTEIVCDKPEQFPFGTITGEVQSKYGEKITFDCDDGYELTGVSSLLCVGHSQWSDEFPACIREVKYEGGCPIMSKQHGIMCYEFHTPYLSYEAAKDRCERDGGNLATIQSKSVNDFLYYNLPEGSHNFYWTGLTKSNLKTRWASGSQFVRVPGVNYRLSQPRERNCAAFEYKHHWLSPTWIITWDKCATVRRSVCEKWSKDASSYIVQSEITNLNGIYKPVAGLIHEKRPVFSTMNEETVRYLFYKAGWNYGWHIGRYSISNSEPGEWDVRAKFDDKTPDKQNVDWYYWNGDRIEVSIFEYDKWEHWTAWSDCSVLCGVGKQRRTRLCGNGKPGSMECKGKDAQEKTCIMKACAADKPTEITIRNVLYWFVNEGATWENSVKKCEEEGGNLAFVKTPEVNRKLQEKVKEMKENKIFNAGDAYFINIKYSGSESTWNHGDASPVSQTFWKTNEPNNDLSTEVCVELTETGWNDIGCKWEKRYICQKKIEVIKKPCDKNPCLNGAHCIEKNDSYLCFCREVTHIQPNCSLPDSFPDKPGTTTTFTSAFTSNPRPDPCVPDPCSGRGLCMQTGDTYECDCREGFTGRNCLRVIATSAPKEGYPCKPDPCHGGGQCIPKAEAFECFCYSGNAGKYCEIKNACSLRYIPKNVRIISSNSGQLLKDIEDIPEKTTLKLSCIQSNEVVLGESAITCLGGNRWSRDTKIICADQDTVCRLDYFPEELNALTATRVKIASVPYTIETGAELHFQCNPPEEGATIIIECRGNTWTPGIPNRCVKQITCEAVENPMNGRIKIIQNDDVLISPPPFVPGITVQFLCDPYYKRTGAATINCLATGLWSNIPSQCVETGCILDDFELNTGAFIVGAKRFIEAESGDKHTLGCKNGNQIDIVCRGKDRWEPSIESFTCA